MIKCFYSNGKLLLTGEYIVLDGASALAIPTKKGQSLEVEEIENKNVIQWTSYDFLGNRWFESRFSFDEIKRKQCKGHSVREVLLHILHIAFTLNPDFLNKTTGYSIGTYLNFPQDWGLGSSSTLLNNIAEWVRVDAFELLRKTFGGSGYDIASAQHNTPILFRLEDQKPVIKKVTLNWDFKDELFFVHLNKKRNSSDAIKQYRANGIKINNDVVETVSDLSRAIIRCKSLFEFEKLMQKHEDILATVLQKPTIKEALFPDFPNVIKSLGAWDGDFVLATGGELEKQYFRNKGYTTVINFSEMIY